MTNEAGLSAGPSGAAIASKRIAGGGARVGFMARQPPIDARDSGWRFAAVGDTPGSMATASNLAVRTVAEIVACDGEIVPFLGAPVGSAYERLDAEGPFLAVLDTIA